MQLPRVRASKVDCYWWLSPPSGLCVLALCSSLAALNQYLGSLVVCLPTQEAVTQSIVPYPPIHPPTLQPSKPSSHPFRPHPFQYSAPTRTCPARIQAWDSLHAVA